MLLALQTIPEPCVPLHLVIVSGRTDRLSVRRIDRIHPHRSDRRRDHPRLRIFLFVAHRRPRFSRLDLRNDRDAVIRFLSMKDGVISGRLQIEDRKLVVGAFRFLKADHIGLSCRQPVNKTILPPAQRIDVPRYNSHSSSSTPGVGTITSLPGNAAASCERVHSTAGTSPWTSTIFFGASAVA